MQRQILFRGFHPCDGPDTIVVDGEKVKGRWVEGYLYITHTGEYEIGGYCEEYNIERYTYNVLPSTVGQYIGMTDKNGKRVFEDDVLDIGGGHTGRIIWVDGCFYMKNAPMFSEFSFGVGMYEVIGTVFDGEANNAQN